MVKWLGLSDARTVLVNDRIENGMLDASTLKGFFRVTLHISH